MSGLASAQTQSPDPILCHRLTEHFKQYTSSTASKSVLIDLALYCGNEWSELSVQAERATNIDIKKEIEGHARRALLNYTFFLKAAQTKAY